MMKLRRNQKGFTLIEIIAVLVILGILAAVAIPRYFDMQAQAQQKAALGAISEGKARVNQYAAQYMMSSGAWPGAGNYVTATLGGNAGDFTLSYSADATHVSITASGAGGAIPASVTTSGTMTTPGYTY